MKTFNKFALVFFVWILFATGCDRSKKINVASNDDLLRQKIIGTWLITNGIIVLNSDGSSHTYITNGIKEWSYESEWKLTGTNIAVQITDVTSQNTTNHEAIGAIEQVSIVSIDESNLVWTDNGTIVSLKRE